MSLLTPGDKWSGKKRLEFAALKRKRCLGTKEDELLYEKERVVKKPRMKSTKHSHRFPLAPISSICKFILYQLDGWTDDHRLGGDEGK